ncbi:MAG: molybdate ABC transporter substrate-binding protein [Rhodobacteraceae bacterium]|nr:molybdate ABC transporter substrate-binding protein [Paracoccaceae bacterium]
MVRRASGFLKLLPLMFLALLTACADPVPNVAAASDLRLALTEVAVAFERDTGDKVELTFGSSGNFYRQLQEGGPFDLYLSADEEYALNLAREGLTVDNGALYAIGRLVIIAPQGSPLAVDNDLEGLRSALANGEITRFAIANPEHAPYGARAEEALRHAGLWDPLADRLVLGENVSQALQFATAGGAQGGIVAYSLALDPALEGRADYALIPDDWHQPLRQRMVLMKDADPVARSFYDYLQQPAARSILARYGFVLPDGER